MDNRLPEELQRKYTRVLALMYPVRTTNPYELIELADLQRDILASGQSEADYAAHVGPDRYNI